MEKTFRIMPHMCHQQQQDVQTILAAADDIGAAATSVAQGGMGYSQLIEARDRFKEIVINMNGHYRVCVEEDVNSKR